MASIAKTIADAIYKVSTEETYANMEFATREEARDSFTAALLFELGLGPKPVAAHAPVTEPKEAAEPAKKAPKKRVAKKSTEAVVAEAAVAVLEQVKVPEVEALAEQMGQLALDEQPKPKKARKTKTESAPASSESESEAPKEKKKPGPKPKKAVDPHPGMGAGVPPPEPQPVPPVAEKKKPGPKPKSKPEGAPNVEKLTPTHKKHIKSAAEEMKVAIDEKEFLAYANAMSAEEWGAKSVPDHLRAFVGPTKPTVFLAVEFNGKDYLIDPKTRFVYEPTDGVVKAAIGEVGKKPFDEMEMPEEEDE